MDEKNQVKLQMVERWDTISDGLTWTFKLRSGLAFHDGAPVTAADVVASLKRWAVRDNHGQLLMERTASLDAVDAVDAVDAGTVRLVLKKRWGLVLEALGKPSSLVPFVMPARIARHAGHDCHHRAHRLGPLRDAARPVGLGLQGGL